MGAHSMIGVIGGSGLYQIEGLEDARWINQRSTWGTPSDEVLVGRLDGRAIAFLPRHGRGHRIGPSDINARANIDVLKRLGCTDVIAISAVGSLREDYAPGDFVLVDQFIDRTRGRDSSFFGTGCVAHVGFSHPTCPHLGALIIEAAKQSGISLHPRATYLAMEGPQFSTLAESNLYRQWGADVIGMTALPEAKLAREAELCYANIAMVTDYDCWHPDHGAVDVAQVISVMQANTGRAKSILAALPKLLSPEPATQTLALCPHGCDRALDGAIMTAPSARDPKRVELLEAVAGRVLKVK